MLIFKKITKDIFMTKLFDDKTSKIKMSRITGTKKYLKGSDVAHNEWMSLDIVDEEGRCVAKVDMSMTQFSQMLVNNSGVSCTITHAFDNKGNQVKDIVEPPKSVKEELNENLQEEINKTHKRFNDLVSDLKEMIDGKATKKKLKEVLHQLEVFGQHVESNQSYFTENANEMMDKRFAERMGELINLTTGKQLTQEELYSLIGFEQNNQLLDYKTEEYVEKEREVVGVDDMTPRRVAEEIHIHLKEWAKKDPDGNNGKILFYPQAREIKGGVSIQYISYQGSTNIILEDAKKYLKFLNDTDVFKTHFSFLREK